MYRYMKTLGISNLDPSIIDYDRIVQNSNATKYIKRLDTVKMMDPSMLSQGTTLDQNIINLDLARNLDEGSNKEIKSKKIITKYNKILGVTINE